MSVNVQHCAQLIFTWTAVCVSVIVELLGLGGLQTVTRRVLDTQTVSTVKPV